MAQKSGARLPLEIITNICAFALRSGDVSSVRAVMSTSSTYHTLVAPLLYRNIDITASNFGGLTRALFSPGRREEFRDGGRQGRRKVYRESIWTIALQSCPSEPALKSWLQRVSFGHSIDHSPAPSRLFPNLTSLSCNHVCLTELAHRAILFTPGADLEQDSRSVSVIDSIVRNGSTSIKVHLDLDWHPDRQVFADRYHRAFPRKLRSQQYQPRYSLEDRWNAMQACRAYLVALHIVAKIPPIETLSLDNVYPNIILENFNPPRRLIIRFSTVTPPDEISEEGCKGWVRLGTRALQAGVKVTFVKPPVRCALLVQEAASWTFRQYGIGMTEGASGDEPIAGFIIAV